MNKYKPIFFIFFLLFFKSKKYSHKDKQRRLMIFTATEQPKPQGKGGTDKSNCFSKPTVS